MDEIQKVLVKAGRKDLAQKYYLKVAMQKKADEPLPSSRWIQSVRKWLDKGWLYSTYHKQRLPKDVNFYLKMIEKKYPEKGIITITIKDVTIEDVNSALSNTDFNPEKHLDIYVSRPKAKIKQIHGGVEIDLPVSNLDETFDWVK